MFKPICIIRRFWKTNHIISWQTDVISTYESWNFNSGNYLFTTDTK